ncbi:hypothetical protein [Paraglaciecola sp. T6c]|uniref:hypothetical protein n=1 Tax=Pseudoalteromonas atlantica (strain T6c / ATCC BAA-1087) TaxID=3042615 RepID=UPI0002FA26BD|nr:hypothetical protein [Paraglaciecola sp. T6c]
MKTFQDRYNLHADIESIENYIDGTFRKLNRTSRSLHKPLQVNRYKSKWNDEDQPRRFSH